MKVGTHSMTKLIFQSKNKMINIRPKKEILIFPSSGKSNPTQVNFFKGSLESDSSKESLQRPLDPSTFNFPSPTYTFIHPQDSISNSNLGNANHAFISTNMSKNDPFDFYDSGLSIDSSSLASAESCCCEASCDSQPRAGNIKHNILKESLNSESTSYVNYGVLSFSGPSSPASAEAYCDMLSDSCSYDQTELHGSSLISPPVSLLTSNTDLDSVVLVEQLMNTKEPAFSGLKSSNGNPPSATHSLGSQCFLSLDDFEDSTDSISVLLRNPLHNPPGRLLSDYRMPRYTEYHLSAPSPMVNSLSVSRRLRHLKRPLIKLKPIRISITLLLKLERQRWQIACLNQDVNDGNYWQDIFPDDRTVKNSPTHDVTSPP